MDEETKKEIEELKDQISELEDELSRLEHDFEESKNYQHDGDGIYTHSY
jgi:archaellum component FlaC